MEREQLLSFQRIAGHLAQFLSVITIFLVSFWADNINTEEKYLGGLHIQSHAHQDCNWHAILMTVAMGFCLVQSVLAYRLIPMSHLANKILHFILHTAAIICAIIGVCKIVHFHNKDSPLSNLTSLHSWLGLFTLALFFQNYILGFIHFLVPILSASVKSAYLPGHKVLGFVTLVSAFVTMETGIIQKDNTFGCDYDTDDVDTNPASNYGRIPAGCRLSSGLGLILLLILGLVTITLWKFPKPEGGVGNVVVVDVRQPSNK